MPHTLFGKSGGKEEQRFYDDINYNDHDDNRSDSNSEGDSGNGRDDSVDDEGGIIIITLKEWL